MYLKHVASAMLGSMLAVCVTATRVPAQEPNAETVDFVRDIQPILASRCLKCHGRDKSEGGLRLTDLASATKTLESGSRAVVPTQTGASELLRRVSASDADERMPPEGPPLTDRQIARLNTWIATGATWPTHWAYAPLLRPRLPDLAAEHRQWVRTPVDVFVMEQLLSRGLARAARRHADGSHASARSPYPPRQGRRGRNSGRNLASPRIRRLR